MFLLIKKNHGSFDCCDIYTEINKSLNWKSHVNVSCNKVLKYIAVIHRTKKYLPFSVLQTMYKSLILPIIYYGLLLWGPHCERLFLLQKRIMHVITNSKYIAHTDPIFKTLNLLKLPDLYRLQLYKLYYKSTPKPDSTYRGRLPGRQDYRNYLC